MDEWSCRVPPVVLRESISVGAGALSGNVRTIVKHERGQAGVGPQQ